MRMCTDKSAIKEYIVLIICADVIKEGYDPAKRKIKS